VLRDAALVMERQSGRYRYYSLQPEPLRVARDWLGHYERFWEERLDRFGSALRARHGTQD
jgi:DNA-binding transcriptional ArsR family regulator